MNDPQPEGHMASHIGRRKFLATLGSAAAVWPLAARAQQPAMPVIGFLSGRSPSEAAYALAAFHQGLRQGGFAEGQNVAIEYRWAEGQYDRLPALAADLVHRHVAVIAATGGTQSALAAEAATATIPIVFGTGDDPVKFGLVASLNRPGRNSTGVNFLLTGIKAKRLGLLHDLVPTAALIGVLFNPNNSNFETQLRDVQEAAHSIGQQIHVLHASSEPDIHAAFKTFVQMRVQALLVGGDRRQSVVLTFRPAILDRYVLTFGESALPEALMECCQRIGG